MPRKPAAPKNILDCFPLHLKPREVQKNALLELERRWDQANIFVVNLPVASGKSGISVTLAKWRKQASIITPSKLLVDQYKNEYSYLQVLRAKSDYWCSTLEVPVNKRPQGKKVPKLCSQELDCEGCDQYRTDLRKSRVMPYLLSNYHIYLAHKLYKDTLIIDEAHALIDMLKQMNSTVLWQFNYRFPTNLTTRDSIKQWVNSLPESTFHGHYTANGDHKVKVQSNLLKLKEELNAYRPKFLVQMTEDTYKDEVWPCIKMIPLDIRDAPPIMWPDAVKKMVLLSATLSRKDIEQLGLADKKIQYIQADSPIQAERRPVILPAQGKSMAYKVQDENLPYLAQFIEETALHNNETKGLIHATYSLSSKLKSLDWSADLKSRLIFHDKNNKAIQYQKFRESDEPKILVASGMYEGIDLPYDAGRWQVLAKIPWPSLGDPAIKWMANEDEEWYAWETSKVVLQACGRICRTPEDYGVTYVYDKTFRRLLSDYGHLYPNWFHNSVKLMGE